MSQEYTEDKEVTLRKLSSGRRLLEALLIIVAIFAIYLMVALVSFNPSDPSWSQTAWHEPIHNLGGGVGAWLADTLLFIFGVLAYAIPLIMLVLCWAGFRQRQEPELVDYFGLSLRLIGTLALVVTSCGLAALNIDDLYYFASGGVIGSLLVSAVQPWFNSIGATLSLLCVWAAGLTLFTGWSWLVIAERIGGVVLAVATFATNRSRGHNRYHDDEYDDEDDRVEQRDVLVAPVTSVATPAIASSAVAEALPVVAEPELDDPLLTPSKPLVDHHAAVNDVVIPAVEPVAPASIMPAATVPAPAVPPVVSTPVEPPTPVSEPITLNTHWDQQSTPAPAAMPRAPGEVSIAPSPPVYKFEVPDQQSVVPAQSTVIPSFAGTQQPSTVPERSPFDFSAAQRDAEDDLLNSIPSFSATGSSGDAAARVAANAAAAAATATTATHTFMPAFSATSEAYSQVKQGLGPELPRPNRVRIPTRRELASYGIKLPSQRLAEQQQREQPAFDLPAFADTSDASTEQQEDEQAMAQLSRDFAQQQQQRYAEQPQTGSPVMAEPEISAEEQAAAEEMAALGQAFAAQQQARYQGEVQEQDNTPNFGFSAQGEDTQYQEQAYNHRPAQQPAPGYEQPYVQPAQQGHAQQTWQTSTPQPSAPVGYAAAQSESQYDSAPALAAVEPTANVAAEPEQAWIKPQEPDMDSLIHPFLMRNELPLQRPTTKLPTLELLTPAPKEIEPVDMFALEQKARLIEASLADYRVKADVVDTLPGPVITRFELDLAPGVKAARISNLSRDLARSLSTSAVRVVEVIPGKPYVGLELPNAKRQTVYLREVLDCPAFRDNPSPLAIVLGKDISGEPVVADLAKMPHLLVAGTTGSGKSVGVNAMILSILYKATPKEVRFIMIDPKMLELSVYEGIPHLLTDVVTDMKDAANALRWCVGEMERRYKLMSALGVRNLAGYNERVDQAEAMGRPIPDPFWKPTDGMGTTHPMLEKEPYIVVMVDEFADLMMTVGKKVEELIARLAQKARAAGIHLVLATQRPSVDVITGLIKANIPTRIAFTVSSKIDSRTILDQGGAESLLGMGDMLYLAPNSSIPVRVHGAFVRDQEVHAVVSDWKARERPQYKEGILSAGEDGEGNAAAGAEGGEELDPLFDQAVAFVIDKRRASISGVQRQFRIGYNRAARIIEQMELQGIVSEQGHNGNREVLAQHHPD